jgi:hypothetical protein
MPQDANVISKPVAKFSKAFESEELYEEAMENSLEAWKVGSDAEFFRAPRILGSDPAERIIEFELLDGWTEMLDLIRSWTLGGWSRAELLDLFQRTGYAAAEYHAATGKIHGDFYPANVLCREGDRRVFFIDFSRPDPLLHSDSGAYNRGSIYTDLALFAIFVLVKYTPMQMPLAWRPVNRDLIKEFLRGYFERAPGSYDPEGFGSEFSRLLREGGVLPRTFMSRFFGWTRIFRVDDLQP